MTHVLVTGSHRSGTTWVGRTLSLASSLDYIHEPFNVNYPNPLFGYEFGTWFLYAPGTQEEERIYRSFMNLFNNISNPFWRTVSECRGNKWNAKLPLWFIKRLIVAIRYPHSALIKDPLALMSAGWLYDNFDVNVICMTRSPLGFAGSLKKWNWDFDFNNFLQQKSLIELYLKDFEDEITQYAQEPRNIIDKACLLWNCLHSVILQYKKSYPEWHFVRYESIAREPTLGFQKMFEYLGLRYSAYIQEEIARATSASNPTETNSTEYKPRNSKGSIYSWQERLKAPEIERVITKTENVAGKLFGLHQDGFAKRISL